MITASRLRAHEDYGYLSLYTSRGV
jgi:hypothetical protein